MKNLSLAIFLIFQSAIMVFGQEAIDELGDSRDFIEAKNSISKRENGSNPPVIHNVIPSPTNNTNDIAFDGEHIWVAGDNDFLIYQISIVDGSLIRTIPTDVQHSHGLMFDGTNLWLSDGGNGVIQQIDTANGNVIYSFDTPDLNPSYLTGLAWDGNSIWSNDVRTGFNPTGIDVTLKIDTIGVVLEGHAGIGDYPTGLAFDGQYLWSTDNIEDEIYKINPATFAVIDTIEAPGGNYPNGLAFDGQFLWVANRATSAIYQIDISSSANDVKNLHPIQNTIAVYPNPTAEKVSIQANTNGSITLFDITGKQVLQKQISGSTELDLSVYKTGVYLLRFESERGNIEYKKLVKE
jgi:hypothetical protein